MKPIVRFPLVDRRVLLSSLAMLPMLSASLRSTSALAQARDPLAGFVGCTRDEIALLRNATEANSYIANGIDMKPGDEVLMPNPGFIAYPMIARMAGGRRKRRSSSGMTAEPLEARQLLAMVPVTVIIPTVTQLRNPDGFLAGDQTILAAVRALKARGFTSGTQR